MTFEGSPENSYPEIVPGYNFLYIFTVLSEGGKEGVGEVGVLYLHS